jgi:hypothetical protein
MFPLQTNKIEPTAVGTVGFFSDRPATLHQTSRRKRRILMIVV